MNRLLPRLLCGLVLIVPTRSQSQDAAPNFSQAGVVFLKKHCIECHSGEKPKAELSLAGFIDNASVVKKRKTWESVFKMIESGEMPPDDKPQPTSKEIQDFATLARAVFEHHDKHAKPDPGRVTMRRLNRVEYANTLRDLVGADFNPAAAFPSDDISHGFDDIGDVLTLSPVLMGEERTVPDAPRKVSGRINEDIETQRHRGHRENRRSGNSVTSVPLC